jgi:hypothetical protein
VQVFNPLEQSIYTLKNKGQEGKTSLVQDEFRGRGKAKEKCEEG